MLRGLTFVLAFLAAGIAGSALQAAPKPAQRAAAGPRSVVLVTLDGLSWTEVFRGADEARAKTLAYVPADEAEAVQKAFVAPSDRAKALAPFLHEVIARQGVLLGDRDHGGCAAVANARWFSYPGYNEILTGRADDAIVSNEHGPNKNVTVLEWLNHQPGFAGRVQAVTSWANFADIINAPRSGVPVNAGWEGRPRQDPAKGSVESQRLETSAQVPHIWPTVRFDTFTHAWALDALRRDHPRVLYIAYGETDDFAHDGRYDQVLWSAYRTDAFLAELWRMLQADPVYAGKTTMIITTDHGRGLGPSAGAWRSHGKPAFPGSDQTWMGLIGPDVPKGRALAAGSCASASQVAASLLQALGLDWRTFDDAIGAPLALTSSSVAAPASVGARP